MPAPGHSYLGDFVKDGGFIDVGYDALVDMLEGSAASDTGLFNYEEGDDKSDRVLTRNRGTILRVLSAYGDRIRDPLKQDASFFGLLRAHETAEPDE